MSTTLLKQSAMRTALRNAAPSALKRATFASSQQIRTKATLPDLPCSYSKALAL